MDNFHTRLWLAPRHDNYSPELFRAELARAFIPATVLLMRQAGVAARLR